MNHRFGAAILFEVTVAWNQELDSFTASGQTKAGELHWEIGGERHYPTFPDFTAALRAKGVTLAATEANRLITDQESAQAAAARKKKAA